MPVPSRVPMEVVGRAARCWVMALIALVKLARACIQHRPFVHQPHIHDPQELAVPGPETLSRRRKKIASCRGVRLSKHRAFSRHPMACGGVTSSQVSFAHVLQGFPDAASTLKHGLYEHCTTTAAACHCSQPSQQPPIRARLCNLSSRHGQCFQGCYQYSSPEQCRAAMNHRLMAYNMVQVCQSCCCLAAPSGSLIHDVGCLENSAIKQAHLVVGS